MLKSGVSLFVADSSAATVLVARDEINALMKVVNQ